MDVLAGITADLSPDTLYTEEISEALVEARIGRLDSLLWPWQRYPGDTASESTEALTNLTADRAYIYQHCRTSRTEAFTNECYVHHVHRPQHMLFETL